MSATKAIVHSMISARIIGSPARRAAFLAGVLALFAAGCGKEGPTELDLVSDLPPTPAELIATVGESSAEIRWKISDSSAVASYRVYRGTTTPLTLVTNVTSTRFTDRDLVIGRRYLYQVSAVSHGGTEGSRSESLPVTPSVFGVIIQSGSAVTGSSRVTLSISAPLDAAWMIVGNDSLFTGMQYEALAFLKDWFLPDGDGEKRVYVRYRDPLGVETQLRSDAIVLDTRAVIASFRVTEGRSGPPISDSKSYVPGDTLFFSLDGGEAGGDAAVSIGSELPSMLLGDAGVVGDRVAGDGVYELAFVVYGGLSVTRAPVIASFFDRAGNEASPAASIATLTLDGSGDPPPAAVPAAPGGVDSRPTPW